MAGQRVEKGNKRWYPCPKCGDQHPSVTTVLDVMGSRALMGWMAKNGTAKLKVLEQAMLEQVNDETAQKIRHLSEERWKMKEKTDFWKSGKETGQGAADIGNMCHAWIEAHLKGTDVSLDAYPEQAKTSIAEMLKWEKEHHLETIKTETTFYNCKLNYAGTADWFGKLDGELSLGDWKTSSGIYLNYVVQGWAYALADETENAVRLYRQIFVGRFGKDGDSEVRLFKRNEFPSMELARDIIIACGHIFKAQEQWEEAFPYNKKPKEKIA